MNAILTADQLFTDLQRMPAHERERFFLLLSAKISDENENLSYEEVFGDLDGAEFTASEAAEYLEVSMATFRRYVRSGKFTASSVVGSSHLYPLEALCEFKNTLRSAKRSPG